MAEKAAEGVYFTAYINPYLNTEGSLYEEAAGKGNMSRLTMSAPAYKSRAVPALQLHVYI